MKNLPKDKIVTYGKDLYYRLKPDLEKKYSLSDYISFEVQSGDYFVGKTPVQSLQKAKRKYPDKEFFLAQIGNIAGTMK